MDRHAKDCHAAVALIQYLFKIESLRQSDITAAFRQLRERLPDLTLDVPDAPSMLEAFSEKLE
jgi:hypothetical protein